MIWARGAVRCWSPGACTADCAAQKLLEGEQALGVDELEQSEFEVEALLLAVVEIVEGAEDDLQIAGDFFFREKQGSAGGAGTLVAGDLEKLGLCAAELGHEGVAQIADHLAGER